MVKIKTDIIRSGDINGTERGYNSIVRGLKLKVRGLTLKERGLKLKKRGLISSQCLTLRYIDAI